MSDKKTESASKKKSWVDRLKSIALEEEPSTTEETPSTQSSSTEQNQSSPSKFVYSDVRANQVIPAFTKGQFDEKLFNGFLQHMEEKNLEGVDYLEFSKAKKGMDKIVGMSEPLKFQSAFATLSANSPITKEHLLETADFYIKELENQKIDFQEEMKHEIEMQVTSRQKEIENKNKEILDKQEQMNKLQMQINEMQVAIGNLNNEASIAEANIQTTENNFNVTLEVVKGQILQDKQNITNFIN